MQPNNYVKLSLFTHAPFRAESFVFPFRGPGHEALAAAQALRAQLRAVSPESVFQVCTFKPSALRGVPVVGETLRGLALVEAA